MLTERGDERESLLRGERGEWKVGGVTADVLLDLTSLRTL